MKNNKTNSKIRNQSKNSQNSSSKATKNTFQSKNFNETPLPEPLPESSRPRKDGPGGN